MDLIVLVVPYDSGTRDWRMGAGPKRLLEFGLIDHLESLGHSVAVEWIEADERNPDLQNVLEINSQISELVRRAANQQRVSLILAGNCNTSLGVVAGLSPREPAVLWMDAHGDFNTPETSRSGFIDGMAASALTGRCWRDIVGKIPGFHAIDDGKLMLMGTRDLDEEERQELERSEVKLFPPARLGSDVTRQLDLLCELTSDAYVHLDLDVLDPSVAQANPYAAPNGITVEEAEEVLTRIAQRFQIRAITFSSYAPECDAEGRIPGAAFAMLDRLIS